jgi:hypothetical protein
MNWFWQLLSDHPIVLFFLLAGLANVVGSVLQARRKAAQQASRAPRERPQPPWSAPAAPAPAAGPPALPAGPRPRPTPRPAADIGAEMRRILGLDVEGGPVEAPARRPAVRQAAEPAPAPLASTIAARRLDRRAEPRVGEGISGRKEPKSGRVGAHRGDWGTLGGRGAEQHVPPLPAGFGGHRPIDLRELKRVILGAEILAPPVALRDPGQRLV